MTTVLRASDSADFLRLVPALAGFTPRHSIVLLPFHGGRTHGAMRLDIPTDDTDLDHFAEAAIGLISRVSGTDALALVAYSDASPQITPDGLVLPHAVTVDELLGRAEESGLHVVDALCVTPDGWSSYLHDDPQLGALDLLGPIPDLPGIGDVGGDQMSGLALPASDCARTETVGRALRDIGDVIDKEACGGMTGTENAQALAALASLDDMPAFFESVLDQPETAPPSSIAALLWCLERPIFRDVAIAQWATGIERGIRTLEAQFAFAREGRMMTDDLGQVFLGQGPAPDRDRLRLALTLVRHAAAASPRASRPGPLTAAAWLSWALGRSSHAAHYLDLVREIDPEYGLAALLCTMIDAAVLPDWAFGRGSAFPDSGGASTAP